MENSYFFELFRALAVWALILPSVYGAGRLVLSGEGLGRPVLAGIVVHAIGFAIISYSVLFLSFIDRLSAAWIWGTLVFFAANGFLKGSDWLNWWTSVARSFQIARTPLAFALFGIFIVSSLALLLGTLTPELGGDALNYQLNLPKVFLGQGSLEPIFFDYNSYFPLFMNNLFLVGLATGGVFAAKLFHLAMGFLLFLALKEVLDEETENQSLSFFVALVVLCTPAIYNLLSTTYIDVGLAFYAFLSVVFSMRAIELQSFKCMLLSGVLAGCGIAMKYLGLITLVGLLVVILAFYIFSKRKRFLAISACALICGALLISGYWFLRNWLATGNPFFPYWGQWFGLYHRPPADHFLLGLGRNWFYFISMYFNMFLSPNSFGAFTTRIGIFYFLFLPFVLIAGLFVRKARGYAIFWLVFTAAIYKLAQADRWILPVLPIMALLAGMGIQWLFANLSGLLRKICAWVVMSVGVILLSVYALAGAYHYRYAYFLTIGQWSIQDYLMKLERTTGVSQWVNANLPANAKIYIESEPRHFYFDRALIKHDYVEWRLQDERTFSNPILLRRLLKGYGVTHLLTADLLRTNDVSSGDSRIRRMLSLREFAKEIFNGESKNIREDRFRYRVYELL